MKNAIHTLNNILETKLYLYDLRYCLVDQNKRPYKIDNTLARPNKVEDFVDLDSLFQNDKLDTYAGIGISIQASNICAIDVDHCFSIPFNISSSDERAKDIINRFKNIAYIEFSFSGTGLRVLFKENIIDNYSNLYYIKNETVGIEYYQPTKSFRYVTVTGSSIYNNEIKTYDGSKSILIDFLNKYMLKPIKQQRNVKTNKIETRSLEQLLKLVKYHYLKDGIFQNLWFDNAPGSGKNESERDYHLMIYLFENITQDKKLIKEIFESSPFFKSKDRKHMYKWNYQNFRYFEYLYKMIQ